MVAVAGAGLVGALLLEPRLVAVLAIGGVGVRSAHRRASARAVARTRAQAMPELVDLFAVAASAGLPVAAALRVVADRSPPAVRTLVVGAEERRARGLPIDRCLAQLGEELGPPGLPLVDALRRAAASGAALSPMLDEVAAGAREARRRSAEAAARRLPVAMLLPLAGCILPAAVLLAVVPVVIVSISALAR